MRHIRVPEPILATHPVTKQPIPDVPGGTAKVQSFLEYACNCWLNDPRAGRSPVAIARWTRVVEKFMQAEAEMQRAKRGAVYLSLEDADYATLRAIVEAPEAGYAPLIAASFAPFWQAVLDATEELPADKDANGVAEAAPPS